MRLTCPNCGAQYEVPDEVIPETGRDVQCSNCGDTWFQTHPSQQTEEDTEAAEAPHPGWDSPEEETADDVAPEADGSDDVADEPSEPEDEPVPEADEPAEPEVAEEGAPDEPETPPEEPEELAEPTEDEGDEGDDHPAEESPEMPSRRGLDPSIADILREEASREEEARAAESGGLETQPDLGLDGSSDDEDQRSQQAKSRMARMRGLPEDSAEEVETPEPDPGLISRRNLLPDIDEINSSLDSESVRAEAEQAGDGTAGAAPAGKGGFGAGFRRVVLLVLVLVVLYILAPTLSENVPALAGVLNSYVDTVNAGRIWLNDWLGTMVASE
ncbi:MULTISPECIES: zinc-ribbon domain-containing protein [unclassified Roseovarius]|uniref:zinc-ribbon domain-containing protein n=1 Tax=unclassified Roseovarius TaxID=2614913 RepID=UPI00273ED117|nr:MULTISPECIES: zinc-ribbon domain-containing protein [unclassified Roseovarius]